MLPRPTTWVNRLRRGEHIMSNIDLLRSIAGVDNDTSVDYRRIHQENQKTNSEKFISQNKHLKPEKMLDRWWGEHGNAMSDRELAWNTAEGISKDPGFYDGIFRTIDDTLNSFSNVGDQRRFFQENMPRWNQRIQDRYKDQAMSSVEFGKQEDVFYSRIANRQEDYAALSELSGKINLNPSVSLDTHKEHVELARRMGFNASEISTDIDGFLSIPVDGNLVPVYTIPEGAPNTTPMEDLILKTDLSDNLNQLDAPYREAQAKHKNDIFLRDRGLVNLIGTEDGKHLKGFELPIILNAAEHESNPVSLIKDKIGDMINSKISDFENPFEAIVEYVNTVSNILELREKRNTNGKS